RPFPASKGEQFPQMGEHAAWSTVGEGLVPSRARCGDDVYRRASNDPFDGKIDRAATREGTRPSPTDAPDLLPVRLVNRGGDRGNDPPAAPAIAEGLYHLIE